MKKFIGYYLDKIKRLKCDVSVHGVAPHKPVFLLALIKIMQETPYHENTFHASEIQPVFQKCWTDLVVSTHECDHLLPFNRLVEDGLWHVDKNVNERITGHIDKDLYLYFQLPKAQQQITKTLFASYFSPLKNIRNDYLTSIENNSNVRDNITDDWKKYDIAALPLTPAQERGLRDRKINTVEQLLSANHSVLNDCRGIGVKSLYRYKAMREELQKKGKSFFVAPKGSKEYLNHDVSLLGFTLSLNTALYEKHVRSIADFIAFDINIMADSLGVGVRKLRQLRTVHNELQQIYPSLSNNLSNVLSQTQQNVRPPDPAGTQKRSSGVSKVTSAPCLSKSIRCFFDVATDEQEIWTLGLSEATLCQLQRVQIYKFDPISFLLDFTIDYYWCRLDRKSIAEIFSIIFHTYPIKYQTKLKLNYSPNIPQNILGLPIPSGMLNRDEAILLQKREVFSFKDWCDLFAEEYFFSFDNINIVITLLNTYPRISRFLMAFESVIKSPKSIIEILEFDPNQRDANIFLDKICGQMTLEKISIKYAPLTRERVRQICKAVGELFQLSKFNDDHLMAAIGYVCDAVIHQHRGVIATENLTKLIQNIFIFDYSEAALIKYFILTNYQQANNNLTVEPEHKCCQCELLKNEIENSLKHAQDCILSNINICTQCPERPFKTVGVFSDEFINYFLSQMGMSCVLSDDKKSLITESDNALLYGSLREAISEVLEGSDGLSIDEIFDKISLSRPTLSRRSVHGRLQNEDFALVARGCYMLTKNVPLIPQQLLLMVKSAIEDRLKRNDNIYLHASIVYDEYQQDLAGAGIHSEYILYEALKIQLPKRFRYIKCPYITNVDNKSAFNITEIIEDYVYTQGRISTADARTHFETELGISPHVFSMAYNRSPDLIIDGENYLTSLSLLNISSRNLQRLVESVHELTRNGATTVYKVFEFNKVTCALLGIKSPKLLFSILKKTCDKLFAFRFPQITDNKRDLTDFVTLIDEYFINKKTYCSLDELCAFAESHHFPSRTPQMIYLQNNNIFRCMRGAYIHKKVIEWTDDKNVIILRVADDALKNSVATNGLFNYLENIIDHYAAELPPLAGNMFWTTILLGDILSRHKEFIVYGNYRNIYSRTGNAYGIKNFGDLCGCLLNVHFDGATNLEEFSKFLRDRRLISYKLTESMLSGSTKVVIDGREIHAIGEYYA